MNLCILVVLIGIQHLNFHIVCMGYFFGFSGIKTLSPVVSNIGIEERGGVGRLKHSGNVGGISGWVEMSRLSFRPRPLDIHKKLPIVKSIKDFEDDEAPASTRNSQLLRAVPEVEHEVWTVRGVLSVHPVFQYSGC